jgi:hypothetical protein
MDGSFSTPSKFRAAVLLQRATYSPLFTCCSRGHSRLRAGKVPTVASLCSAAGRMNDQLANSPKTDLRRSESMRNCRHSRSTQSQHDPRHHHRRGVAFNGRVYGLRARCGGAAARGPKRGRNAGANEDEVKQQFGIRVSFSPGSGERAVGCALPMARFPFQAAMIDSTRESGRFIS